MAKVRIENTTEGGRHLHFKNGGNVLIPPAAKDEGGKRINGFADVDESQLKSCDEDPVVRAWFDDGDLLVKKLGGAQAGGEKTKVDPKVDPAK